FSVTDTGIGIPKEKQQAIFESFTQADSSTTRRFGGTGLGLSISRRLVEAMEGRIWVESEVGRGSTFSFEIPFGRRAALPCDAQGPESPIDGLRMLIVDDNDTNRLILRETLSRWGVMVAEASTGVAALAELERSKKARQKYDL